MQRKRQRLSKEHPVEVFSTIAQSNSEGAQSWPTRSSNDVGSGLLPRHLQENDLQASMTVPHSAGHVPVAPEVAQILSASGSAGGNGNVFPSVWAATQRTHVGASPPNHAKASQIQRRVWVREDPNIQKGVEMPTGAEAGLKGAHLTYHALAMQRRLQRQGRLVPSLRDAVTAAAPMLSYKPTHPAVVAASSAAPTAVQAEVKARIAPIVSQVGGPIGQAPSSQNGRRVWVRPTNVSPPAAILAPHPASAPADGRAAATAGPGRAASGLGAPAVIAPMTMASINSGPTARSAVAPRPRLTAARSITNLRSTEVACVADNGADIAICFATTAHSAQVATAPAPTALDATAFPMVVREELAKNLEGLQEQRSAFGIFPAMVTGPKPDNTDAYTSQAAAAATTTALALAVDTSATAGRKAALGAIPHRGTIAENRPAIPAGALAPQLALPQAVVAQAAARQQAIAVKPPLPQAAATLPASRRVESFKVTAPASWPHFGQYLRPGRHKLVRKAASGSETGVALATAPVAGPADATLPTWTDRVCSLRGPGPISATNFDGNGSAFGYAGVSGCADACGPRDTRCSVGGSSSDRGVHSGSTESLSERGMLKQGLVVARSHGAVRADNPVRDAIVTAVDAPDSLRTHPTLRLKRHPAGQAPAGGVLLRSGQLTWRRRLSAAAGAAGVATTGSGSRQAAAADVDKPDASNSTVTTTSGAGGPTSSVTSPPAGDVADGPIRHQAPILLRVGRSKLRPAVAVRPAAAAALTKRGSTTSASTVGSPAGSLHTRPGLLLRQRVSVSWPASSAHVLKGRLLPSLTIRQRRTMAGNVAAGFKSLKLVTVNGQHYYTAGSSATGGVDGVRQLHSLRSIAGKAAASTAAAAASQRQHPPTAAAAMASRAIRLAVWRRRCLDPTSPTTSPSVKATAVTIRQRALLRAPLATSATVAAATVPASKTPTAVAVLTRVRKLGGGGNGRAAAAQRILAKARMRRAAAQATKTRGYCPDYCRTGVCSVSRDPSSGHCPHTHDPTKVAVCSRWLAGSCTAVGCHLQHRQLPDLMPLCTYFLQGKCTAADCPYLHKTHAVDAPACRAFLHSYCSRGAACPGLHLTTKMARERARLLTAAVIVSGNGGNSAAATAGYGGPHSMKRQFGDGVSGPGPSVSTAEAVAERPPLMFAGVALNVPKRRRGGFRYFDAEPECDAAAAAVAAGKQGEALPSGKKGPGTWQPREAASRPTPSSELLPPESQQRAVDTSGRRTGVEDGETGKIRSFDSGSSEDGAPVLLPGGMMLYL